MHQSNQEIIDQCELAIRSVVDLLSEDQAKSALDYVLKYDEWLLGIEFAFDSLDEEEIEIFPSQYLEFEKAFILMSKPDDARLALLKARSSATGR
jgi:hypothetical protein